MTADLVPASEGAGPLLQRDYWAIFDGCPLKPSELMGYVKAHFCELPPASLVEFVSEACLATGVEVDIHIRPLQQCRVRVVHADSQSVTLGTVEGHPEAGRITFGAYRNARGELIFHIRSRARSADRMTFFGFKAFGEAMQTNTWADFITTTASAVGATVRGAIHAESIAVDERPDDGLPLNQPTFAAVGD